MIWIIVIAILVIIVVAESFILRTLYNLLNQYIGLHNKHFQNVQLLTRWMDLERQDKDFLVHTLKELGFESVAIYGYGYMGKQLYYRLKDSEIEVSYIIDRNRNLKVDDVDIIHPEKKLPKIDVILVSVVDDYFNILKLLRKENDTAVRSLEEIIC